MLTAAEVLSEAEKDRVFMEESGGGVTFSGGEPLLQCDFLVEACSFLKARDYHVAIDTCGYADTSTLKALDNLVDLYLYDLKLMDPAGHLEYTGVHLEPILNNLTYLLDEDKSVWVRIPIIPGVTDGFENLKRIRDYLKNRSTSVRLSLIPYHKAGSSKYARLGLEDKTVEIEPPKAEDMEEIARFFRESGFGVIGS